MALIRKNWQKDASNNGVKALSRVAGAGVAAFILTKLTTGADTNAKTTIKNISGPALTIAAVLGDMMFEDNKLRALCQGMYTYGALKSVAVIAPSVAEPIGLRGLGEILNAPTTISTEETPEEIQSIEQGAQNDGNNWQQVAEYIEEEAEDAIETSETSGIENFAASMN